jgi:hypothetical protein
LALRFLQLIDTTKISPIRQDGNYDRLWKTTTTTTTTATTMQIMHVLNITSGRTFMSGQGHRKRIVFK